MNDRIEKAYRSKELISLQLKDDLLDDYLVGIVEGYDENGIVLCNIDYRGIKSAHIYLAIEKISDVLDMPYYLDKIRLLSEKQKEKGEYLNFNGEVDIKRAFLGWIYRKSKPFWIRFTNEEVQGSISSVFDNTVNIAVTDEVTGERDGQVLILLSYMDYFGAHIGCDVL